jgi:hypothetical protein
MTWAGPAREQIASAELIINRWKIMQAMTETLRCIDSSP